MRRASVTFILCFLMTSFAEANPTKALFDALRVFDNNKAVKEALEAGANVKARNEDGDFPLHVAARVGNALVMEDLVEAGADVNAVNTLGQTALHVAAAYGHGMEVRELIRLMADVDLRDIEGNRAYDLARFHAESDVRTLLRSPVEIQRMRDPVRRLAQEGARTLELRDPAESSWLTPGRLLPAVAFALFAFVVVKNQNQ